MGGGEDLDDDAADKDEGKFVIHSFQHYSMHATIICWNYSLKELRVGSSWVSLSWLQKMMIVTQKRRLQQKQHLQVVKLAQKLEAFSRMCF